MSKYDELSRRVAVLEFENAHKDCEIYELSSAVDFLLAHEKTDIVLYTQKVATQGVKYIYNGKYFEVDDTPISNNEQLASVENVSDLVAILYTEEFVLNNGVITKAYQLDKKSGQVANITDLLDKTKKTTNKQKGEQKND